MHATTGIKRLFYKCSQIAVRGSIFNAHFGRQVFYEGLDSHPYDIVHVDIVSKEIVFIVVHVNQTGKTGVIESEKIQEITVLSKMILVGGIVESSIYIA
jgi:hypothetical protein